MRRAYLVDQGLHRRIGLQQLRKHRQQPVSHIADLALADLEIEHRQKLAVRAGIGDERDAAFIGHGNRLRHSVMGMAAENDVDAGDAAGELEVDVHAVMREQDDGIDLVGVATDIDELLQLFIADAEFPVRCETLRVRDRHVGERLSDYGDATPADFLDDGRLEHAARCRIERLGVVEGGFLGEEDVLRQEFALEAFEVGAQRLFAIGEFPMAGHRLDAEKVGGVDHVGALQRVGKPAALPEVAAVEQQRAPRAGLAAHPVDQGFQMRKAAELAESPSGFFKFDAGESIGVGTVGPDAEAIEKRPSDQMRRIAPHRSDADIDARLAEEHRPKLRMGIGDVQNARIAEALKIVNARIFGAARQPWQAAR